MSISDKDKKVFKDLDTEALKAHWAVGDSLSSKPKSLTQKEEMDLLISDGIDAVKASRADYQAKLSSWEAKHQLLVDTESAANSKYQSHGAYIEKLLSSSTA